MRIDISGLVTEEWLRACPTGVLVRDDGGDLWANPALEQLLGMSVEEFERQWETTELRPLLEQEGLLSLRLGNGSERWLSCSRSQVPGPRGGTLELRFFQDSTDRVQGEREREEMERRVQELSLTDPLTGLANRRALGQALAAQVTRSRRYRNPLSIAMVRVELPGSDRPIPDSVILSVSRFLRERLRWADLIGREEQDCFLLILPETEREAATALLDAIQSDARQLHLPPHHETLKPHLAVGVRQWNKGLDGARLVAEARRLMDAAGLSDASEPGS